MSFLPSSARRVLTMRRVVAGIATVTVVAVLVPTVSARQQDIPANTAEPTISGSPAQGQTLTANPGTWSGTPAPTFAYQWLRCPPSGGAADGSDCPPIDSATAATYVVAAGDVGFRLRVRVTGVEQRRRRAPGGLERDGGGHDPGRAPEHRAADDHRVDRGRGEADRHPGDVDRYRHRVRLPVVTV